MQSSVLLKLLLILYCTTLFSCTGKKITKYNAKITIQEIDGKYSILKNGKIFDIKGASGYTNFAELKRCGGNAVRIWDTLHVDKILKEANENDIAVIIGLPIPESQHLSYYNNHTRVSEDFVKIKRLVNRIKSNPAILMWAVGNELTFPNNPSYNNFYKTFDNIVDMIHEDDPDHPITTTIVNFKKNDLVNIKIRTNIDIISFNIFSRIDELRDDLKNFSWFWNGPYIITEWAIDGPWDGAPVTAWNAKIEPTSSIKAKNYLRRYKRFMPVEDPRFLGSFIFFWGQKQEITHTWFSMFDEFGNETEAVSVAEEIWKGKISKFEGPKIQGIILSNQVALDNIILETNELQSAEVLVSGNLDDVQVQWEIYPEDWYKKNNVNNLIRPKVLSGLIHRQYDFKVNFRTPNTPGPYRLFATVLDAKGNIANVNIPFYVIGKDGKN